MKVVHCKRDPYDVYIGRPSPWGNPFAVDGERTREEALEQYEKWIVGQPALMAALPSLKGKTLGCWCAPKDCHGHILVRLAQETT